MRILVTGGAGYIGSHAVVALAAQGHEPHVLDDFSNSTRDSVVRLGKLCPAPVPVHVLDVRDRPGLAALVDEIRPEAVMHFAGLKSISESIRSPALYQEVNVRGTANLLWAMEEAGVHRLVFSSSATVYGEGRACVDETCLVAPSNPYAQSKVQCEQLIREQATRTGLRFAILRYFNPAGAHDSGVIGEAPTGPPGNLMPSLCDVAIGRRDRLTVYGTDYPTPDGTGIRDYIHVMDLVEAHLAALARLPSKGGTTLNLGTGKGLSVLELVAAFEKAAGRSIPLAFAARRPGDIATLYADARLAATVLGWSAQRGAEEICADAWRWTLVSSGNQPHR